ncbi:MAG: hypothetical protein BWX88_03030 [Planctomycetes bacterium ADurb.Bin126]|nr:MAG: hypothetical protein BWX88_03030 [Planctomycetes bacterium ADurb.Bin126]HOD84096.1 hypothetical protein [Phycisphaerae bacterium]HQL75318.1 hypothetical protein [Phycisphaerae bacterium]
MRRDKLTILAIFLVVVGGTVLLELLRPGQVQTEAAAPAGELAIAPGEYRGLSLQLHTADPSHPWEKYVDEIAQTGANTIKLVVAGFQENGTSTSIFIEARKVPSTERLRALIAHCRKRNLRVVLMPIVLLENPRDGEWRGRISPSSWDDWWEDYTNYVLHYARLAADCDVEILMVGSELISTETQTRRWQDLIARVRKAFRGKLSYSANWDHYTPIKFWDRLDLIGMTTYYDLTGGDEPTVERLMKSWGPIKKDVLTWQRTIGKPILFTEVGWPNQKTCAQYPWDYYRSTDSPDPLAQANCFEAFFRTWAGEKAVAGFLIWEWRNAPGQGGPEDTSYIPCGKLAMKVIDKYLRGANGVAQAKTAKSPTARSDVPSSNKGGSPEPVLTPTDGQ